MWKRKRTRFRAKRTASPKHNDFDEGIDRIAKPFMQLEIRENELGGGVSVRSDSKTTHVKRR